MQKTVTFENFNWGWLESTGLKDWVIDETVNRRVYEKFFEVEAGDIVIDAGASVGPFAYSVIDKSPKVIHCIEPERSEALIENTCGGPCKIHNFLIGDEDNDTTRKFSTFIKENGINRIDFLKTDCEGGEYSIFNLENCGWLIKNVSKISGEWHLRNPEEKQKFREFRDLYLKILSHKVYAVNDVDITWSIWTEEFINYYTEVIVYIDNR